MAGSSYTLYYGNIAPDASTIVTSGALPLVSGNVYGVVDDIPSQGPVFQSAVAASVNVEFTFPSACTVVHFGVAGLTGWSLFGTCRLAQYSASGGGTWLAVGSIDATSCQPLVSLSATAQGVTGISANLGYGNSNTRWRVEFLQQLTNQPTRIGQIYLFANPSVDLTPEYTTVRRYQPKITRMEADGGAVYTRRFGSTILLDQLHYSARSGASQRAQMLVEAVTHAQSHRGMIADAAALYPQSAAGVSSTGVPLPADVGNVLSSGTVTSNNGTLYPVHWWDTDTMDVTYSTYGQFAFSNLTLRMDGQG